jgi:hypothetical protein
MRDYSLSAVARDPQIKKLTSQTMSQQSCYHYLFLIQPHKLISLWLFKKQTMPPKAALFDL